jgi:hypothetical protein
LSSQNKAPEVSTLGTNEPAVDLRRWLSSHRNVPPSNKGQGDEGARAARLFAADSASRGIYITEDSAVVVRRITRLLRLGSTRNTSGGREPQMQAARSFIRSTEIELLVNERLKNVRSDFPNSPWHDPGLEPPPCSIGNAVAWRPPTSAEAEKGEARLPPPSPAVAVHTEESPSVAAVVARRTQVCSCCSQIRSLGHVRICAHTNKTCSRCRK